MDMLRIIFNFCQDNVYKFYVLNLCYEMKILDVCVSIIFVGKEKPSMYCICHLSELTLNLVDCIKSSSHLHNVLPTNTQINSILWKITRVFFLRHYFQLLYTQIMASFFLSKSQKYHKNAIFLQYYKTRHCRLLVVIEQHESKRSLSM